jgi:SAM-dependent methyltransferase
MIYKNKHRNVGSQSEIPTISTYNKLGKKIVNINGYQSFTLSDDSIIINNKKSKFSKIERILNELYDDKSNITITDIGCSAGLTSFICNRLGYAKINSIDHDSEYIAVIKTACNYMDINNIYPKLGKFGDIFEKTDVVIMLALIHWIYSCTAEYGKFDLIFEAVKHSVGEYLLIEWVDPNDIAVKSFNHIGYNKNIIKEEYTLNNFEKSILSNFSSIEKTVELEGTNRILYVIKR